MLHRITSVDVHVAGEPLRVITGGFPELPGRTILAKRLVARERYDHLRTALMWEPRGHPHMYGCVLVPPSSSNADFGVVFMHNEGYSSMCGHGIIGLVTVLLEQKMVPMQTPETVVTLETPSGLVTARAAVEQKRVRAVAFRNVPSFVTVVDASVDVPGLGVVRYDLAFGGAFYAFCSSEELGLDLKPESSRHLSDVGMRIKHAVAAVQDIVHPVEPDLGFLYGTIFVGPAAEPAADCRQVCIFADGALDRSPTGTGVSAHLAIRHAKRHIALHQCLTVESILGTRFLGRIQEIVTYEGRQAIVPEVEGEAYLTGKHEFFIDPEDPLKAGFFLR